jgi:hypothetical protein
MGPFQAATTAMAGRSKLVLAKDPSLNMKTDPSQVMPRVYRASASVLLFVVICAGFISLSQSVGCARKDNRVREFFSTNAPAAETVSAGNYLMELQKQNRLPGVSNIEHGQIAAEEMTLSKSDLNKITYPIQRTFNIVKDGDRSRYHYRLVRSTKDAEWKLDRAWRTDSSGRVIEDFP